MQKTITVNGQRYSTSQVDRMMTPETQCRHPGAYRIMLGGVEWIAEYRDPSDGYYTPVCSRSRAGAIRLESIAPYYRGEWRKIVWLEFRPD